jgi:hypothetical protein
MTENLLSYFNKSKYLSVKWKNYFPIYENIFKTFRDKEIIIVEIGVFSRRSLFMWWELFEVFVVFKINIKLYDNKNEVIYNKAIDIFSKDLTHV